MLRILRAEVQLEQTRVTNTRNLMLALLSRDEDMALLNLSILADKPWLYDPPLKAEILDAHTEVGRRSILWMRK